MPSDLRGLKSASSELDAVVGKALAPIRQHARLLTTMPGVSDLTAQVPLAEIGADMTRFPDAAHLVSWAGLCPRNDESAAAPCAQERHLAEDGAGHRCVGGGACQDQLPAR